MLNRRQFLAGLSLAPLGLQDWSFLPLATSNNTTSTDIQSLTDRERAEIYHVFVPYELAKKGGLQELTLRSGNTVSLRVPRKVKENEKVYLSTNDKNEYNAVVIFHTLYDPSLGISEQILREIDSIDFRCESFTKKTIESIFGQVCNGNFVENFVALDLLKYIVESSRLDNEIKERYSIGSQNSYVVGIKNAIDTALAKSDLDDESQKLLLGTYEYIRASEPVPNFKALKDLDAIINGSTLPVVVKQNYAVASAISRAYTADLLIVDLIFKSDRQDLYLDTYNKIRNGEEISETELGIARSLDKFLKNATENQTVADLKLPENAYAVYDIARNEAKTLKQAQSDKNVEEKVEEFYYITNDVKKKLEKSYKWGSNVVPVTTKALATAGAEAGTGAVISNLSGAAAVNATLAFLGGGSVAAGGLGMLGGLTVATGGAALIGAAGLLSVALVADMDAQDFQNLGVALGTGAIAGSAVVYTAWTAAAFFGVAQGLTGAAYISSMIATLGGVGMMTGGAALVASGVSFLVWYALKNNKKREWSIVKQLEARLYTLNEELRSDSLQKYFLDNYSNFIADYFKQNPDDFILYFISPNIPLYELSSALENWAYSILQEDEKVIALIDTSGSGRKNSTKNKIRQGIALTQKRLIWNNSDGTDSITYEDLEQVFTTPVYKILSNEENRVKVQTLFDGLVTSFDNPTITDYWVELLKDASHYATTLNS